ncbi:hypothetical protein F4775DRAFT_551920 [Biscogniauxia sp. FL1348]|nr:hypothetical protein F4775DRAFT_551920 [Biscogniauxia sp. FL1348]
MRKKNRALKLAGFAFGEGSIFSTEAKDKIQEAVLGTDEEAEKLPLTTLRSRASEALDRLFVTCLAHSTLGEAVRLGPAYWKVVSDEWDLLKLHLEPKEVEEVVSVFVQGRESHKQTAHTIVNTKLSRSVDEYIDLRNSVRALPPAAQFKLELRPTALEQTQMELRNLKLQPSTKAPEPPTSAWPPKHFNQHECIWVSDSRVRWQLYDVSHLTSITNDEDYPLIPHSRSHPIDVKLLLCWMRLVKNTPTSSWALYMAPIGFLSAGDRKDWYLATGSLSKMYDTIGDFSSYAKDQLENTHRTTVAGLFSFWP